MKYLYFLTICFSISCFSQPLQYAVGGNVLNAENEKIKSADVRKLIAENEAALALYNSGRMKKTVGNLLFYGGIGLAAYNFYDATMVGHSSIDRNGFVVDDKVTPVLAIVGGALFLASFPVKLGYTKKVKAAIAAYNKGVVVQQRREPELKVMASANGFGLMVQF